MEISSLQHHVKATQLPLEKLAGNSQLSQSEKISEVSRQFEAVLLRQILDQAQKPVFKSNTAGSSVSGDVYKDLINKELADQISRSGSIGLGRDLNSQLNHQLKTAEKPTADEPPSPAVARANRDTNHS